MRSRDGDIGARKVFIKVESPTGKIRLSTHRANPGKCFIEQDIEQFVERCIEVLDEKYPKHEFRFARCGFNQLNFICIGERVETQTA